MNHIITSKDSMYNPNVFKFHKMTQGQLETCQTSEELLNYMHSIEARHAWMKNQCFVERNRNWKII